MTRYYVILTDENGVTFPIKALLNPYEDPYTRKSGPARCGGMPQFFGGRAGYKETPLEFLTRVVKDQSIDTISLNAATEDLRDILTTTVNGERYVFYRTERWSKSSKAQWPSEEIWNLLEPEYRVMSWIAQVPKASFKSGAKTFTERTTKLEALLHFYSVALLNAPGWVKEQSAKASVNQFSEFAISETLTAFYKFFRCWCLD